MIIDKAEKLRIAMNVILDDITVIVLSAEMLEIRYKQHMNEETKMYFKNIKNHCNHIVKTINENNIVTNNN